MSITTYPCEEKKTMSQTVSFMSADFDRRFHIMAERCNLFKDKNSSMSVLWEKNLRTQEKPDLFYKTMETRIHGGMLM